MLPSSPSLSHTLERELRTTLFGQPKSKHFNAMKRTQHTTILRVYNAKKHCSQKLCFSNILFFCVLRFTSSHTHYHLSDHKLNPTLGINSVSIRLSISHKKWEKEQPIIRVFVRACCFLVLAIFHVTKLQFF